MNGFPLRLVVPGWYATYWVKMLNDIQVLEQPDPAITGQKLPTRFPTRRMRALSRVKQA